MTSKEKAEQLLTKAGVEINGPNPWDIQVHDERLYDRIFSGGSLAFGEAYMDGWWDAKDVAQLITLILRSDIAQEVQDIGALFYILRSYLTNAQSRRRSRKVVDEHYDVAADVYEKMLDPYMQYTCGYWKEAKTLNDAQEAKLDLICKKLGLKPGMTLLDIGCGWGGLAQFAAEKYGAQVTGITISKEQLLIAQKRTQHLPVEIRFEDYRDTQGQFDRVVSVGMFEHVGPKNYKRYMQQIHKLLKDDGLFLLHTIGSPKTTLVSDPWIDKYIFPGGVLPSVAQVGSAINKLFIVEDWHNFGADYDKTLEGWYKNFIDAWPELKNNYSERFFRMWCYYLLSCAGGFRSRHTQLWQIVLSKKGVPGGYASVR